MKYQDFLGAADGASSCKSESARMKKMINVFMMLLFEHYLSINFSNESEYEIIK